MDRSQIWATLAFATVCAGCGLCDFIAVTFIPAAAVFCLNTTSTVLMGLVLFSICWNEGVTVKKILFALICVGGVILVIQPWIDLNHPSPHDIGEYYTSDTDLQDLENKSNALELTTSNSTEIGNKNVLIYQIVGYTSAVLSGILLSLEILVVKRNPYIMEQPLIVLFWGWTFGTVASVIIMFIVETPVLPGNWFDVSMVTIHSVTYTLVTPLLIYGSNTVSGNTVTVIVSTKSVLMLISQYTVLSSILPGHRNWIEVVGVILVILGASMSSILELIKNKRQV